MIRMIFSTVRAPQEPALTVESLAIRQTGRPSIGGRAGDHAVGRQPIGERRWRTRRPRRTSPRRRAGAIRSRANSLPFARWPRGTSRRRPPRSRAQVGHRWVLGHRVVLLGRLLPGGHTHLVTTIRTAARLGTAAGRTRSSLTVASGAGRLAGTLTPSAAVADRLRPTGHGDRHERAQHRLEAGEGHADRVAVELDQPADAGAASRRPRASTCSRRVTSDCSSAGSLPVSLSPSSTRNAEPRGSPRGWPGSRRAWNSAPISDPARCRCSSRSSREALHRAAHADERGRRRAATCDTHQAAPSSSSRQVVGHRLEPRLHRAAAQPVEHLESRLEHGQAVDRQPPAPRPPVERATRRVRRRRCCRRRRACASPSASRGTARRRRAGTAAAACGTAPAASPWRRRRRRRRCSAAGCRRCGRAPRRPPRPRSAGTPVVTMQNSSPPMRAARLPCASPLARLTASATATISRSPASWPNESLTCLSRLMSASTSDTGVPSLGVVAPCSPRAARPRRAGWPGPSAGPGTPAVRCARGGRPARRRPRPGWPPRRPKSMSVRANRRWPGVPGRVDLAPDPRVDHERHAEAGVLAAARRAARPPTVPSSTSAT